MEEDRTIKEMKIEVVPFEADRKKKTVKDLKQAEAVLEPLF